jgi:urease accessory protein
MVMPMPTQTSIVTPADKDTSGALLRLLQLASPALPVGAYSYSEGLEYAVEAGWITDATGLRHWLDDGLRAGSVQIEAAIMCRAYRSWMAGDYEAAQAWDEWLTASRETEELRVQSRDMGRALIRLLQQLETPDEQLVALSRWDGNFAAAFGIAAARWAIAPRAAALGYLQSWAANLISAGIKLVPLGQTDGQRLLRELEPALGKAADQVLQIEDEELASGGFGMVLASCAHETQYTRLFRS